MKKLCKLIVSLSIIVTSYVCAEDIPTASKVRGGDNWTGLYWGINVGGYNNPSDPSTQGALGGIQLGYDYQFNQVVVGAVASFDWTLGGGKSLSDNNSIDSSKFERFGTFHARAGVTFDKFLFYFLAGAAYAKTSASEIDVNNADGSYLDLA